MTTTSKHSEQLSRRRPTDEQQQKLERWPLVDEETLGRYPIFSLTASTRRSPVTGRSHRFWRLDAPDWVNVVAVTGDGQIILVEQYRHGTDDTARPG